MGGCGSAVVTGVGVALPAISYSQEEYMLLEGDESRRRLVDRIAAASGISQRHVAVSPLLDDVKHWSTAARMRHYQEEALPLSKDAVASALTATRTDPADIGLVCVASSTGYAAPGLDTRLARDVGISPTVERLLVGHMGCVGALPALAACANFVRTQRRPAVLVNAELSSLHLQPPPWDTCQRVVNALFGDAVTATVIQPERSAADGHGLEVVDVVAHTDTEHEDYMALTVGDHGFRMDLSPRVPDVLERHLRPMVSGLLARHALGLADVRWWAVHPGGPRILDAAENSLGLPPEALAASRHVLREHGNCASAGLPLVVQELQHRSPLAPGHYGLSLAFGPGLTLYAVLFLGV
ncbi:putative type III polyketide synthase [Streptomyces sp. NBRC 110611]|uniref:type III polyketide synthase n=1 Tax=Streptomyces sp. NBRC 110611 TaxID=1621259 RepID=UPI00082F5701|nr:type III polyketide synthase [Streptomyces sp. NBRC 110611]GAU70546.1 putative type III polyketide synthase [Streptomyces sp. NBRC 110611]